MGKRSIVYIVVRRYTSGELGKEEEEEEEMFEGNSSILRKTEGEEIGWLASFSQRKGGGYPAPLISRLWSVIAFSSLSSILNNKKKEVGLLAFIISPPPLVQKEETLCPSFS